MFQPAIPDPSRLASEDDGLVIGLVNNMPDAALQSTERQFRALLDSAAHGNRFRLRLFYLPELPRTEAAHSRLLHYETIDALWNSQVHGLIVTGTEPRAACLAHEPYWCTLTRLVEWAEDHTISTIWSCLSAHAAVRHLDGIERHAYDEKLCGVFACQKALQHLLLAGLPDGWSVPHSRCNGLSEQALRSHGYSILSASRRVGVDMFCRHGGSLFIFMQGHLEYDTTALMREYRRDVSRFLAGERSNYPALPEDYFGPGTAAALDDLREQALRNRSADVLLDFPIPARVPLTRAWEAPAVGIYGNWLDYLGQAKLRLDPAKPRTSRGAARAAA